MAMIKIQGSTKIQGKTVFYVPSISDEDVLSYIAAVEDADGQELEGEVKLAYNSFITGCKSDGIWSDIKASCILAGARTLDGALVPLVGTAPTNNNFVSGDYNRETGLIGDGSTKYLDSNRAANDDPQNDAHISIYRTEGLGTGVRCPLGSFKSTSPTWAKGFIYNAGSQNYARINQSTLLGDLGNGGSLGFYGLSRENSSQQLLKSPGVSVQTNTTTSGTPPAWNLFVFASNTNNNTTNYYYNSRLSFYSIGEALDLSLLDSRVSTLMTDLAAAI